ncbi:MAG: HAMP domain-containing protein [Candidatus Aminicenantes bacterium]|nr:HAMP domain-containing protein [Candidatus Aminicenantes bacterium]NIM84254.1 HAMP domain-containing protein [Candidatus Aminicenantes bacterium]NIN23703.1 HAMP domain-containing protein [Candidatus Aminicenantes bacterium]NIN47410.1 HAMP domain-containing protein [Candidatus Aminicenantes bacterium]NIN90338.1 HAMP domain-containing protein [Candidatus Aminicenantes bacterium]
MKKTGLGLKIMIFTILLVVITAGILIYFSYITSYADLEKAIGERLEAIASTGALMIDGDLHDQIKGPEDADSEAFKKLQKVLRDIKKKNNINTPVYTFRREEGKVKFIVMTQSKPFIGDTYDIREEMWPALNEGKSNHTKIFKDENGVWISAYAPIFDSNGNISGILDVDIKLTTFQQQLQEKVNRLAIISIIILVLGILLSFLLSRRLVKNLRYLTDVTKKISTGMMDRSIKVTSEDEVGELAESLERMRVSLKLAMEMISEKEEE